MSRSIDHLVLAVHDLSAGRSFFQQLGFQTAPLGVHPFGTGNHNIFFDQSFLEILSVLDTSKIIPHDGDQHFSFSAFNAQYLSKRQGVSMMVVNTEDARADEHRLKIAGWQTYTPFHFSRPNVLPDGSRVEVAFTATFCSHSKLPNLAFFVCQHHNPEHVWQKKYQQHPNQIKGMSEIDIICDHPSEVLPLLASLFNTQASTDSSTCHLDTAKERINILRPARFKQQYGAKTNWSAIPAFGAITFNLEAASWTLMLETLHKNNVPFTRTESQCIIHPEDAFGVFLKMRCLDL